MPRTTLTDKYVKAATSNGKPQDDHYDVLCPGLCLRVTLAGKKTWTFVFTSPDDKARARLTLGTYSDAFGLKLARTQAEEARAKKDLGIDPRKELAPDKKALTIADLIEDRLALEVRGKLRSADKMEARFKRFVIPVVGTVPVKDFRVSPHYNDIIQPILKTGAERSAGLVFQDLRKLFNYAVENEVLDYSPISRKKRPDKVVERDRYLTCPEIVTLWTELPTLLPINKNVVSIVKLLLATGQRAGEVCGMTRTEIDLDNRVWTIPAARAKNGFAHKVPLSDLAMQLLGEALRRTNDDVLFPDPFDDDGGPLDSSILAKAIARIQDDKILALWRCHDLRRTVATQMSMEDNALEIPDLHISHVLNHRTQTKKGITQRVYNKNDYLKEKKGALDKWGKFLAELVGEEIGLRVAAE